MADEHDFIRVQTNGHCLEVTLNRPDVYNALHNGAHNQLHAAQDAMSGRRKPNNSASSMKRCT